MFLPRNIRIILSYSHCVQVSITRWGEKIDQPESRAKLLDVAHASLRFCLFIINKTMRLVDRRNSQTWRQVYRTHTNNKPGVRSSLQTDLISFLCFGLRRLSLPLSCQKLRNKSLAPVLKLLCPHYDIYTREPSHPNFWAA